MTNDPADLIRRWFSAVGQAGGPLLPDGWFGGRPHENTYVLEAVRLSGDVLEVELSEETTLCFYGFGHVSVDNSDLVFDGYLRATLRWKHYGGDERAQQYQRDYQDGQIRLTAPIGVTIDLV